VLQITNAYQASRAVHVAAALGIADLLVDGPRPVSELAAATRTDPAALYRLLRGLASVGVFQEVGDGGPDGSFALTPPAEYLRSDTPGSVRNWAVLMGRPYYQETWAHLETSIRSGGPAFREVHGVTPWEYRVSRPDESAIFDAAMTGLSSAATGAITWAYDFSGIETLVDVGGGHGEVLAAILTANPGLRGTLFDQPHVVAGAPALLERAGVSDRCEVVGGSFFESVPAGAGAYLLKSIVHDWADEPAIRILRTCRAAMLPTSRLLLVEMMVAPPNEPDRAKLGDLNMLVMHGGRERTADEFRELLAEAGLRMTRIVTTTSPSSIVEGVPA
jgi:hypothetical protein